jgi:hypothetical protein
MTPIGSLAQEGHLPECIAATLAQSYPDERKPEELSEAAWTEVYIAHCAPGCPILRRSLDRGVELAEEKGW